MSARLAPRACERTGRARGFRVPQCVCQPAVRSCQSPRKNRADLTLYIDAVAFDQRISEQLFAHRLDRALRLGRIALAQFEVDHLALAHIADAVEPERGEGMRNGLALRIEHARLGHDLDARLDHYCTTCGVRTSPGAPSFNRPSRRATS